MSLLDFLSSLFGRRKPTPPPQPPPAPDDPNEPAQLTISKVLVIVYDPPMQNGQKLSQTLNWQDRKSVV